MTVYFIFLAVINGYPEMAIRMLRTFSPQSQEVYLLRQFNIFLILILADFFATDDKQTLANL
jgi:hypothetical protein